MHSVRNKRRSFLIFGTLAFCFGVLLPGLIFIQRPNNSLDAAIFFTPNFNKEFKEATLIRDYGDSEDELTWTPRPVETDANLHTGNEIGSTESGQGGNDVLVVFGEHEKGSDPTVSQQRDFIRMMMKDAWDSYEKYAWGHSELKPLSKQGHSGSVFGAAKTGATIVDSLDTLYIMGFTEEYKRARDWVAYELNFNDITGNVSVFETNIRFVGGLLAMFSLTGDTMYKNKAYNLANQLLPAFDTPTGIPLPLIHLQTGTSSDYVWSRGFKILTEFGTLHLEFMYLSDITGDPIFKEKVLKIRDTLKKIQKPKGLYYNYFNPQTANFIQEDVSMGGLGDSFYEYLLKAYIQSGDLESRKMYDDAMNALQNNGLIAESKKGLRYFAQLKHGKVENKMDHLACFSGGMLALGVRTDPTQTLKRLHGQRSDRATQHMQIAEEITNTCHESYIRTATRLGPEIFGFEGDTEARSLNNEAKHYILRPEVIESYFVLWRLTGDDKYRDWGWDAATAIEKYCKAGPNGGYSGIRDVYSENPEQNDVQESFFLAETLKYLYLLFSSDELIDLDNWVFNTEAHPLPIKGANPFYRPFQPSL